MQTPATPLGAAGAFVVRDDIPHLNFSCLL